MKHVNERRRLRRRVAPVLAAALAAGGLVAMSASPSAAATPTSGERIVSWKVVQDTVDTGHIERAPDITAPAGQRFVKVVANGSEADGVLALTDQGKVVVGGTADVTVPQPVLDGTVIDIDTNANTTAFTAVTASGTAYSWDGNGSVASPAGTCAARSATTNITVVGVVCQNGSVEFFPWGGPVPSYLTPPSILSGVKDLVLTDYTIGSSTTNNNAAIAVNGDGEAIRWGEGITGHDAPPRTAGKTMASVEVFNGLTTGGAIVSFSKAPRHDVAVDDGGLDPAVAAEGFVSVSSFPSGSALGFGITKSGKFASWGDIVGSQRQQLLRTLPSGVTNAGFVAVSANAKRIAAIVADTEAPSGPTVSTASTVSGGTGGLVAPGTSLTGTPATFSSATVTTATDWLADGQVIESASGSLTLTVTSAMVDKDLTFRTRATGGGLSAPLDSVSAPVKVATSIPHTVATASTISGSPASGLILTGTKATFDTMPDTVQTRWLVDGTEVLASRNSPNIVLTDAMVGKKVVFSTRGSWDADPEGTPPTIANSAPTIDIRVALTGTASIEGEPVVGNTLTLNLDLTDESPDVQVLGDWVYNDEYTPISGASGSTYKLTRADIGRTLDWLGTGSRYADESAFLFTDFIGVGPVAAAQVTITGKPTISGSPFVGGTLTAAAAPVNDDEADVTLQWLVDGVDTGTTGTTYSPTAGDLGKTVTVKQIASYNGATSGVDYAEAESTATAAVVEQLQQVQVATLTGTPLEGKTLTGTPATFSPTADVTVTNYWVIGDTQTLASGNTLTLTADHVGKTIAFRSIATRGDDSLPSTSVALGPVLAKLTSTTKPQIAGTPQVGQTLGGTPGGFSASVDVTRSNFWVVNGVQQPATGGLALTADLEGKTIEFRSVATRGDETVTSTSDPVGPVAAAPVGSTTTVSAPAISYGQAGSVTVTVSASKAATGSVTLSGAGAAQTVSLSGGSATFALPATLAAGSYALNATYTSSNSAVVIGSAGAATLTVGKGATASAAIKVSKKPTTKKKGKAAITVRSAAGLAPATGKAQVTLKKGKSKKVITASLSNGKRSVSLPKLKKGTWKVSVVYQGDANYTGRTSKTLNLKVK